MKIEFNEIYNKTCLYSLGNQIIKNGIGLLLAFFITMLLQAALNKNIHMITRYGMIGICATVILILLNVLLFWQYLKTREVGDHNAKLLLYQKLINKSLKIDSVGEFDSVLTNDIQSIGNIYIEVIPKIASSSITALVCIVLLFKGNSVVTLIMVLFALLQFISPFVYEKWEKKIYLDTFENDEEFSDWINEGLKGIRTIKSFRQEKWYYDKLMLKCRGVVNAGLKSAKVGSVEDIMAAIVQTVLNYGVYVICGIYVLHANGEITDLPLIIVISKYFYDAIGNVEKCIPSIVKGREAISRIEQKNILDKRIVTDVDNIIFEMNSVSKFYGDKIVFNDVFLKINRNDRVLISGKNGTGKSTLINLLMGYEVPDEGYIKISKLNVSYTLQEETTLSYPISEILDKIKNDSDYDFNMLKQCLKEFDIEKIISKKLNECSGGEKKKIFLAASLCKKSAVLILDEPTNHLDDNGIRYLNRVLENYNGTIIICSHDNRLSFLPTRHFILEGNNVYEKAY